MKTMNIEIILVGLLIVSTLTGLTVEGIKKLLDESGKTYKSNLLAGSVSLILSVAVGCGYVIFNGTAWNQQTIICIICLVFLSWLCSMVGYDKVLQTITQIKKGG